MLGVRTKGMLTVQADGSVMYSEWVKLTRIAPLWAEEERH